MGLPTKQPCGIDKGRARRKRPARLIAIWIYVQRRPRKHSGSSLFLPIHAGWRACIGSFVETGRAPSFLRAWIRGGSPHLFKAIRARDGASHSNHRACRPSYEHLAGSNPIVSNASGLGWRGGFPVGLSGSFPSGRKIIRDYCQQRVRHRTRFLFGACGRRRGQACWRGWHCI